MVTKAERAHMWVRLNLSQKYEDREIELGSVGGRVCSPPVSSYALGGYPRGGKTNIVAHLCGGFVLAGAKLEVLDPDANHPDRGLVQKIKPLSDFFFSPPCDYSDIPAAIGRIEGVYSEYKRRQDTGDLSGPMIALVIDEYNLLYSEAKKLGEGEQVAYLLGNLARGGPKWGIFVLVIAHNWHKEKTGGAEVRDNIAGRICVDAPLAAMEMILDGESKATLIKLRAPAVRPPIAIVRMPGWEPMRQSFPLFTYERAAAIANLMHSVQREAAEKPQNAPEEGAAQQQREKQDVKPSDEAKARPKSNGKRSEHDGKHTRRGALMRYEDVPEALRLSIITLSNKQLIDTGDVSMREIQRTLQAQDKGCRFSTIQVVCRELLRHNDMDRLPDDEWEALKAKYDYTCPGCHRREPEIKLEQEHSKAKSRGGRLHDKNGAQPMCGKCNKEKGVERIYYPPKNREEVRG